MGNAAPGIQAVEELTQYKPQCFTQYKPQCFTQYKPQCLVPHTGSALCSHNPMFPQPYVPTFLRIFFIDNFEN